MKNSYFIYTDEHSDIKIARLHICTWEFKNQSSLVEFGFEVSSDSINSSDISISILIPWFSTDCKTEDLYERLSIADNSRFIFNDSVIDSTSLDGGRNKTGVIHKFDGRNKLCILPIKLEEKKKGVVTAKIHIPKSVLEQRDDRPNLYFRFWVEPNISHISEHKIGINKSSIIYDMKVNERRNIPEDMVTELGVKNFCTIKQCFVFNIVPDNYDLVFFDNSSFRNIRILEDSFNKYLLDDRVVSNEMIAIFNKKQNMESYSFFTVYSKERFGPGHFSLAILANMLCGIFLFLPSYRNGLADKATFFDGLFGLPLEIFLAIGLISAISLYFAWPYLENLIKKHIQLSSKNSKS